MESVLAFFAYVKEGAALHALATGLGVAALSLAALVIVVGMRKQRK